MKKSIVLIHSLILSCFILNAKTVRVPGQYSTIQTALNSSQPGDTILVGDGVYYENLVWPKIYGLTLKSVNGASYTTLDGSSAGAVITASVTSGKLVGNINGFTIQNGLTHAASVNGYVAGGSGMSIVNATISITNCDFTTNKVFGDPLNPSYCNGAAINSDNSKLNISGCQFSENTIDSTGNVYGGVIYSSSSQVTISKSGFQGNNTFANTSVQGGVIAVTFGTCTLNNVSFTENAVSVSGEGSISGGCCYFIGSGMSQFTNVLIGDNSLSASNTVQGGGVWSTYTTSMIHCTVAGNHYSTGTGIGGNSISINSYLNVVPKVKIINSILWNPEGSLSEAAFVGTPNISYCDIYSGITGPGNTASDPSFVSSADFHLQNNSPCLSKSSLTNNPATDLDGNARPMPSGTKADQGCFETNQPVKMGDENNSDAQPAVEIYPNPVHQSATISFQLNDESKVIIMLLDLSGRKVMEMLNETLPSGAHDITINSNNLSAGDYFVQMQIGNDVYNQKITID